MPDSVKDGRELMQQEYRPFYFNPDALKDIKPLSPAEHVAVWRDVMANWAREKSPQRTGEEAV